MKSYNNNVVLHIGMYKTGSTFLQECIEESKISTHQVYLPGSELVIKLLEYLDEPEEDLKNSIYKILKKSEAPIFISSEGILGHQANGFCKVSKRFSLLEELFNCPKYLIFYREPSSLIHSGYYQGLRKKIDLYSFKEYSTKKIESLLNIEPKDFTQPTNYKIYNFLDLFENYLIIQERCKFVEFEKFFSNNPQVTSELVKFIGFEVKLDFEKKSNPSLKNLIYYNFYNRYILFKISKFLFLLISRMFTFKKNNKSILVDNLISFINKIFNLEGIKIIRRDSERIRRISRGR